MNRLDNQEKIDIEKLISSGASVQFHPDGWSMYPLFTNGRDEAIVSPVEDETKLKRGAVVLYRRDSGILVLHRIQKKKDEGFYMVGDNQWVIEGPLKREQIKGIMTGFVRKGKKVSADNLVYIIYWNIMLIFRPIHPLVTKLLAPFRSRVSDL